MEFCARSKLTHGKYSQIVVTKTMKKQVKGKNKCSLKMDAETIKLSGPFSTGL